MLDILWMVQLRVGRVLVVVFLKVVNLILVLGIAVMSRSPLSVYQPRPARHRIPEIRYETKEE